MSLMRFQVASDLHQEFDKDDGLSAKAETLILAGDIVPFASDLGDVYKRLKKKFKTIIHIPGNHEYYCPPGRPASMDIMLRKARDVAGRFGVEILDNQTLDIGRVRIIGSTLWSHIPEECAEIVGHRMNDYRRIFNETGLITVQDTNNLHDEAVRFIKNAVIDAKAAGQTPVVVTHHAPQVNGSVDPCYIGSKVHTAFSTDIQHLYQDVHTWIFGHTHFACDFVDPMHGTRIVSNPKGYPGEIGVKFRRNLVIEIPNRE